MDDSRRFTLLGGVIGAAVLIAMVVMWAAEPTYVPLYADLPLSEAGRITGQLDQAGIKYQLLGAGNGVAVARGDAARARVLLAQQGMPATDRPGLELFDKPTWGMTDFSQRVTYRRALEGELARTIGTLQGVRRAQVHLALHEASPLRRLEHPAEAAVVLQLDGGRTLDAGVVQGITYIVSNSVEQLSSDHVAVMDDSGRLLSAPSDDNSVAGLSSRQLEVQRGIEDNLGRKVESLLATVVGPGAAKAQVTAQLNFEQVDRTIETYDPDTQVIQNEQRSETLPGGGAATAGSQTVINNQFQNSRTIERIVGAGGGIERLTVAVLVDDRALAEAGLQFATERPQLEALVRNAVGLDPSRGDELTMISQPFDQPTVADLTGMDEANEPGLDPLALAERFMRPLLGLLGILAAFLLGMKAIKSLPAERGRESFPATTTAAALPAATPDGQVHAAPLAPTPEKIQLQNRLQAETMAQPEVAAQVVKAWLAEA